MAALQELAMFSVERPNGRIFAIVPGADAVRRLIADDPVWKSPSVYLHWRHMVDSKARIRVRNRIKFWFADA